MAKEVEMKEIAALLSDSNFIRLQKERSAFNAFTVLRLESHEIRHSNVLAWLFDPQESHKFGSAFLEQFLLRLAAYAEDEKQDEKQKEKQENINYALLLLTKGGMHVSVYREKQSEDNRRVDFQIECFLPNVEDKQFVLLIENKVYARQGEKQLETYLKNAQKKFPKGKIIPVYLTLDENDKPSDESYFHLTYNDVLDILESLTGTTESERCAEPAGLFIRDYIKILKEQTDGNAEKQYCAKEIYKNHKDAVDFIKSAKKVKDTDADKEKYANEVYCKYKDLIDFIYKNRENWMAVAGNQFVEQNGESGDFEIERLNKATKSAFYFFSFTDSVLKGTKGKGGYKKDWRDGAVCGYFFQLNTINGDDADGLERTLALKIEVGPFDDSEKRQSLLNILEGKGMTFQKGSDGNSTYTRLSYKGQQKSTTVPGSIKINDVTDVDEVAGKMKELFAKTKKMREKLHDGIEDWQRETQTDEQK